MSRVLQVSKSGYYKWLINKVELDKNKKQLEDKVKLEFENSEGTYGSPRITIELNKKGIEISKTTVARVMKVNHIKARESKKFVITTDSNHDFKTPDNILNRNFEVSQINRVWVSDITYIPVDDDFNYLTTVIDLADRMVVGWHLSNNMTAEDTTIAAFKKAVNNRHLTKGDKLLFHSDRGVQYACHAFTDLLNDYNCIQSMSRKGNCWDNAVAESFFKTIKTEMLNRYNFQCSKLLYKFIFRYIDGWYNTSRINSSLGYITPIEMFYLKYKNIAA
jgi:putative transposase